MNVLPESFPIILLLLGEDIIPGMLLTRSVVQTGYMYVLVSQGDIFVWEVLASPHSRFSRETGRTAQLKLPLRTQSSKCSHPLSFGRSLFHVSEHRPPSAPNAPVPSLARPEFSFH